MNHESATRLLDGFLDCALSAEERAAVAVHLAECLDCQRRLATAARLRTVVRGRLVAAAEAPPHLAERIRRELAASAPGTAAERPARPAASPVAQPAAPWRWLLRPLPALFALGGAVGVGILGMLVGGWWLDLGTSRSPVADVAAELTTQHHLFARDDKLLEVVGDADAVVPWFRAHVSFPVAAPDLPGYEIEGGRIVAIEGQVAAQVVYEEEATERYVSLVIGPASTAVPVDLRPLDKYHVGGARDLSVAVWWEHGVRMALIGPLPEAILADLADALVFPDGWAEAGSLPPSAGGGKRPAPRRE